MTNWRFYSNTAVADTLQAAVGTSDTTIQAGDDVLVLADPDGTADLERYFTDPAPPTRPKSHP